MGNRANVVFKTWQSCPDAGAVYLYTHWGGERLPLVMQSALAEGKKWKDPPVLAQIVLAKMIEEFARPRWSSGGYHVIPGRREVEESVGIAPYLLDNEHPLMVIECKDQVVRFETEGGDILKEFTFEEFATEPEESLLEAWQDWADDEDFGGEEENDSWVHAPDDGEILPSDETDLIRGSDPSYRPRQEAKFQLLEMMLNSRRSLPPASRMISYRHASWHHKLPGNARRYLRDLVHHRRFRTARHHNWNACLGSIERSCS